VFAMAHPGHDAAGRSADESVPHILLMGDACEHAENVSQSCLDAEYAVHWAPADRPTRVATQPHQPSTPPGVRYDLDQRANLGALWLKGLTVEDLHRLRTVKRLPEGNRLRELHAAFFDLYRQYYALDPLFWGKQRDPDRPGVQRNVETEAKSCVQKLMVDHTLGDLPRRVAGDKRRERTPQLVECINLVLAAKQDGDCLRPYTGVEEVHRDSERFRDLMAQMGLTDLAYVWKEMQIVCWLTRRQRLAKYNMYYCKKRNCPQVQQKAREAIGLLPQTFHEGYVVPRPAACVQPDTCPASVF
jgi:hypothetical protein